MLVARLLRLLTRLRRVSPKLAASRHWHCGEAEVDFVDRYCSPAGSRYSRSRRPVVARAVCARPLLLWGRFTEQLPQTRNTRRIAQRDVPVWVLQPLTTETSA